jgi:hypothetical protein
MTMLPSHAGDNTTEVTWPRCDIDAESCWQQCCRVVLAMALQLKVVLAMVGLCSTRDQSIEVLSHRKEARYS